MITIETELPVLTSIWPAQHPYTAKAEPESLQSQIVDLLPASPKKTLVKGIFSSVSDECIAQHSKSSIASGGN